MGKSNLERMKAKVINEDGYSKGLGKNTVDETDRSTFRSFRRTNVQFSTTKIGLRGKKILSKIKALKSWGSLYF